MQEDTPRWQTFVDNMNFHMKLYPFYFYETFGLIIHDKLSWLQMLVDNLKLPHNHIYDWEETWTKSASNTSSNNYIRHICF